MSRNPVTTGLLVVLWAVGAATGSLLGGPAPGLLRSVGVGVAPVAEGRWWVLLVSPFLAPGLAGHRWSSGAQDTVYLPEARTVFAACRAAGMDVQFHVLPGGHSFDVWGPGLDSALPWLGTRLGISR